MFLLQISLEKKGSFVLNCLLSGHNVVLQKWSNFDANIFEKKESGKILYFKRCLNSDADMFEKKGSCVIKCLPTWQNAVLQKLSTSRTNITTVLNTCFVHQAEEIKTKTERNLFLHASLILFWIWSVAWEACVCTARGPSSKRLGLSIRPVGTLDSLYIKSH